MEYLISLLNISQDNEIYYFYTPELNLELGSKFDIKDFPVKK